MGRLFYPAFVGRPIMRRDDLLKRRDMKIFLDVNRQYIHSMILTVRSAGTGLKQHGADRFECDQRIEADGHVLDVVEIVLQLLGGILNGRAIAKLDLSPSREPRFHGESIGRVGNISRETTDEFRPFGTWA